MTVLKLESMPVEVWGAPSLTGMKILLYVQCNKIRNIIFLLPDILRRGILQALKT